MYQSCFESADQGPRFGPSLKGSYFLVLFGGYVDSPSMTPSEGMLFVLSFRLSGNLLLGSVGRGGEILILKVTLGAVVKKLDRRRGSDDRLRK